MTKQGRSLYYFPRAAVTMYHKLGGLRQQIFCLWRKQVLEARIQNQGVGMAVFPLKPLEQRSPTFWHRGPVSWKAIFPWWGGGEVQVVM